MKKQNIRFVLFLLFWGATNILAQDISGMLLKSDRFVALLKDAKYEKATENFDEKMMQALPAEKLKAVWEKLQQQVGTLKEKLGTRTEELGGYEIIYVVCEFEKSNLDIKIVFNREEKIAGLFFVPSKGLVEWQPAAYVKREAFTEVEIPRLSKEWPLPGTLSLPKGEGPFAAVILVHGSGPNDRDESIGPNKPFRDLAWGLASKGIAVLRYEKRTRHFAGKLKSESQKKLTVKEETIDDVISAVRLLRKTEKIDPSGIIIAGHSLGGMLIPRIAALDAGIAGFIMLAAPARPLEELMLEQYDYIFSLTKEISDEQKKQLRDMKQKISNVKKLNKESDFTADQLPFNVAPSYWLDLKKYDILKMAKNMKRPLLILQGERDYQVTMTDYKIWRKELAGKKNTMLKSYPALNHLFMSGKGKSTPQEYSIAGHVDEQIISDIMEWIQKSFIK